MTKSIRWTYGVTTCLQRRKMLVEQTLPSLTSAGFPFPHIFRDSKDSASFLSNETTHEPHIGAWGNWFLGLWELWIRNPDATHFAMFQDDIICVKNLRQYLEANWPVLPLPMAKGVYLNLYSALENEQIIAGTPRGTWHEACLVYGGNSENLQAGRGALALVFDRPGVEILLSSQFTREKSLHPLYKHSHTNIDGGITNAMNKAGFREMVHNPSLVQHIGIEHSIVQSLRTGEKTPCTFAVASTFPGVEFDALSLAQG